MTKPARQKPPAPDAPSMTNADVCARLDRLIEIETERFKVEQESLMHAKAAARASIDVARCAKMVLEMFADQVTEANDAADAAANAKKHTNGAAAAAPKG